MRLFSVCLLITVACSAVTAQTPKVVLVIADGIPADVIERLQPPELQKIIQKGAYKRAYVGGKVGTYTETPTISAPGYNNMLTGTWGYKHNVWDNDHQHPNYNYPSIFRIVKTQRPQATTAIFSTWTDNRTVLLGAGLSQTGSLSIDYVFDGFEKDKTSFPHDTAALYLHKIDDHVIHCADSVIREKAPDLSWIYLEYTDDIGHGKGTGNLFDSALYLLDKQMGKIAAAIDYREANYKEKWLLILTTDHGRDSITGRGHGRQSKRERTTWMIMNKQLTNDYFKSADPGIVDILPSAANFLGITLPENVQREIDGVPFIGPVSISDASLVTANDSIKLSWKSFAPTEKLSIYLTYTDDTKTGKEDNYKLLGSANAADQLVEYKVADISSQPFYKIVIKGKPQFAKHPAYRKNCSVIICCKLLK